MNRSYNADGHLATRADGCAMYIGNLLVWRFHPQSELVADTPDIGKAKRGVNRRILDIGILLVSSLFSVSSPTA